MYSLSICVIPLAYCFTKKQILAFDSYHDASFGTYCMSFFTPRLRTDHWAAFTKQARLLLTLCCLMSTDLVAQESATVDKSQNKAESQNEAETTVGLAAPEDAIILFDGTNLDAWQPFSFGAINRNNDQQEVQWTLTDDGELEINPKFNGQRRNQWLCTKQKFNNYRLHLEFFIPEKGGSNSGLFFGPLYELQILDSTNKSKLGLGDCGCIYKMRLPDSNAALPRGQWQTYDVEYKHAKLDRFGGMVESGAATVTARLNGVLIHRNYRLSLRRNKYAAYPEESTSRIILQDHGAKVKFRNIWITENK